MLLLGYGLSRASLHWRRARYEMIFITTLVTRNDTAKVRTLKSIATPETVPARWSQRHISDTASGRRVSRFPPAASNRPNTVSHSQLRVETFFERA